MHKPRPEIPAQTVREILDYNPETGIFRWRHRSDRARNWNTRWVGKIAGAPVDGYVAIQIETKVAYYAHRLAWLHFYGEWPAAQIDHINCVRSDNRIANLREATNGQNMQNRAGPQRNNTSGFLGVTFHPETGKWRARLHADGQGYSLGLYGTPEEAAQARDEAARAIHGEFAKTSA